MLYQLSYSPVSIAMDWFASDLVPERFLPKGLISQGQKRTCTLLLRDLQDMTHENAQSAGAADVAATTE